MRTTIQLVLPGLFDLPQTEPGAEWLNSHLPALNRLLRLANPHKNEAFSIDSILREALTADPPLPSSTHGLPLAQAFAAPDSDDARRLMLFRAVHLQPDLRSAVIVPIPDTAENIADINILIKDLNDIFNVDCNIKSIAPGLFLIRFNDFDAPTHFPHVLSVLGKSATPYIEQSRDILPWYRLLNEMQMFLYQHPLNQDRIGRGSLPINSLWCWGGGGEPRPIAAETAWICDDLVLNRFAESLRLAPVALQDIGGVRSPGDIVVVDLRLIELLKTGTTADPRPLLGEIEERLLRPLLDAARRDRKCLWLRAGFEMDFELTPMAGLKIWRRRRGLACWSARREDM